MSPKQLPPDYATLDNVTDLVRETLATMSVLPDGVELDGVRSWEVRLLCTKGHFCVDLAVVELRSDLVLALPLGKDQVADDATDVILDYLKAGTARAPRAAPGWIRQSGNRIGIYSRAELTVDCGRKNCSYSGSFEYFSLASELRTAAAAGHAEYRLTN